MISKKLTALGAGVIALGLSAVLAGPAYAIQTRALPAGETLYGIDCAVSRNGQLASVDVTTAIGTTIGAGTTSVNAECAGDSTYDVVSGDVYWPNNDNSLFRMDPTTGDSTYIGLMDTTDNAVDEISALMIGTDGILYAVYYSFANQQELGTVNKATGTITFTHILLDEAEAILDQNSIKGGDYNPADRKFYMIYNEEDVELFELDVTTGALTSDGTNFEGSNWYSLAFDSDGVMWSTGNSYVASSTVAGWSIAGNEKRSATTTKVDGTAWYSQSNFIIPASEPTPVEPTLSATGIDDTQIGLIAAGGAVVVLLGAGAATAARRRKAKS